MRESEYGALLCVAVPKHLPNCRIIRRNVGKFRLEGGRVVVCGIPGSCDYELLTRGGYHLEIETKSVVGSLSADQKRWRDFCINFDIPWLLLRPIAGEPVDDTILRWISEIKEIVNR